MAGVETSFIGGVAISPGYSVGFLEQEPQLDPGKTVFEIVSEGQDEIMLGKVKMNARANCSRFNLSGADQQEKVSQLSGGERNRGPEHLTRVRRSLP